MLKQYKTKISKAPCPQCEGRGVFSVIDYKKWFNCSECSLNIPAKIYTYYCERKLVNKLSMPEWNKQKQNETSVKRVPVTI